MAIPLSTADRKVLTHAQLLELRRQARQDGRRLVHCHGCFDIVHPGHIHHLQGARALGDLLVVTVSADPHVNKGVNRPLIPDDLRARSLAALECVDAVYINPHPTAAELLGELQPDIYVKGREYETNHDPRFLAERLAVESAGGRVVFSSGDVLYSSTSLITTLDADPFRDEKLARIRQRHGLSFAGLAKLVHDFSGMRVVVVGDYVLDRYQFCDPDGVAGESPMMSLRALEKREYDGGAAIVARHAAQLGAAVTLVTCLADDQASRRLVLRLQAEGVDCRALYIRPQLVAKTRFIADESKLFKVDEGAAHPLDSQAMQQLRETITAASDGAAALILADFGYGCISPTLMEQLLPEVRPRVHTIAADVSGPRSSLLAFRGVDLLCPTEREMRDAVGDHSSGLGAAASRLLHSTGARRALVTLGKRGLVTFEQPDSNADAQVGRLASEYLPSFAKHCVDRLGVGDALLTVASLALAAGGNLTAAAWLGSLAAAVQVQRLGNLPIDTDQLMHALHAQGDTPGEAAADTTAKAERAPRLIERAA